VVDVISLVVLGGLWGGSFLFMRVAAPEFGPVALIAVRLVIAAAVLLPLLHWRGGMRDVARHWRPLTVVGVLNSALPFSLLAYATLSLTAGFASVLNGTTPFFAAIVARAWLKAPLSRARIAGLVIGFCGVVVLVGDKISFRPGGSGLAVVAGLVASVCYAIAASYTRRRLPGVAPLSIAAGSLSLGGVCLLPVAAFLLPAHVPSAKAWGMVLGLGVFSTAVAYVLYFRLLERLGPTGAVAVTFLIPAFAMLWGWMFLGEPVTGRMAVGTVIVLAGTGLTSGVTPPWRRRRGGSPMERGRIETARALPPAPRD
jgi:drug/metabolite transporter (DMT)-like permease